MADGWRIDLAGQPGTGGFLKTVPEDFQVEEIPAYEPAGDGEFWYLWVRKRDLAADRLLRELAKVTGVPQREIGMAGLKDKRAITWQWISLPRLAAPVDQGLCGESWTVLRSLKHRNKLRPGHLHGNRFRLVVRDPKPHWRDIIGPRIADLVRRGFPNAYGSQRFGREGQTLRLGKALLQDPGLPVNPWLRRLALSAVQSHVFNAWVLDRLRAGTLRQVVEGEILAHWPRGGLFVAKDPVREQIRLDAGEVGPAGPLPGARLLPAQGEAARVERDLLERLGLGSLISSKGKLFPGARRRALLYPGDPSWQPATGHGGFELQFSLQEGSYATVMAGILLEGEDWRGPEIEMASGVGLGILEDEAGPVEEVCSG